MLTRSMRAGTAVGSHAATTAAAPLGPLATVAMAAAVVRLIFIFIFVFVDFFIFADVVFVSIDIFDKRWHTIPVIVSRFTNLNTSFRAIFCMTNIIITCSNHFACRFFKICGIHFTYQSVFLNPFIYFRMRTVAITTTKNITKSII